MNKEDPKTRRRKEKRDRAAARLAAQKKLGSLGEVPLHMADVSPMADGSAFVEARIFVTADEITEAALDME